MNAADEVASVTVLRNVDRMGERATPGLGGRHEGSGPRASLLLQLRRHPRVRGWGVIAMAAAWLGVLVVVAVTAQWLPIPKPGIGIGTPNQAPHWGREFLGTDGAGRSMLSRIVFGTRISLLIACVATAGSAVIGGVVGLLSAYFGSVVRLVGEIIANTLLSIPGLLLGIFIVLVFGTSVPVIMVGCGLVFVAQFVRLTRANASRELALGYVRAARGLGASSRRIIFRELLPNVWPGLISYVSLVIPSVIILAGGLSFLGYGVQSPTPDLGNMIAAGAQELQTTPWPAIVPCVVLVITVFALITIGDYLRVRLAPRGSAE